jgi:hypothetical protein
LQTCCNARRPARRRTETWLVCKFGLVPRTKLFGFDLLLFWWWLWQFHISEHLQTSTQTVIGGHRLMCNPYTYNTCSRKFMLKILRSRLTLLRERHHIRVSLKLLIIVQYWNHPSLSLNQNQSLKFEDDEPAIPLKRPSDLVNIEEPSIPKKGKPEWPQIPPGLPNSPTYPIESGNLSRVSQNLTYLGYNNFHSASASECPKNNIKSAADLSRRGSGNCYDKSRFSEQKNLASVLPFLLSFVYAISIGGFLPLTTVLATVLVSSNSRLIQDPICVWILLYTMEKLWLVILLLKQTSG